MAAPHMKPLNPDQQALLDQLLLDPAAAVCPICGKTGFWDNRDDPKRPEKAPHWKCKNKDCPGATPLKGRRPYGVWLPDNYAMPYQQPHAPSKRLPPPPVGRTVVPGHAPDAPSAVEAAGGQPEAITPDVIFVAYFDTMQSVAERMAAIGRELDLAPPEFGAIQAATFSVYGLMRERKAL